MATYSAGVALAFDYEVANGTTGSYTPGGDDRAVFGAIVCGGFSGLPSITELRYGGSGGTIIDRVGSDLTWVGGNGSHGVFAEAPGPTGSTTLFGDWAATPLQSAIAAIHYSGVDQTTPFSGHVDATPTFVNAVTTTVASVTVTGCSVGQRVCASVGALSDGVVLSAFTPVSGTDLLVSDVTGTFVGVAMLEKVATGSSETLSVNVNGASSAGLYWTVRGARVNDAAGGATSHPSTGSLVAQDAVVAGTAARTRAHPSSGALAAQAAVVSGSATHLNQHPSTGALVAQAATVAGTAARTRQHPSTGALAAQEAVVAGVAARFRAHPATGALAAQAATVAGDATVALAAGPHASAGSLVAQSAQVSGVAGVVHVAPPTNGQDGGSPPQRKRRRPVDNSPEVLEPGIVKAEPKPAPLPAPIAPPEPAPVPPKLAPLMRQLVELREIVVQQQDKPKARPKKEQKRQAQLEKRLQEAIAQSQELEDDYQAAAAAAELLLMG